MKKNWLHNKISIINIQRNANAKIQLLRIILRANTGVDFVKLILSTTASPNNLGNSFCTGISLLKRMKVREENVENFFFLLSSSHDKLIEKGTILLFLEQIVYSKKLYCDV